MMISSVTLLWIILTLFVLLLLFSLYLTILRLLEKWRMQKEEAYVIRAKDVWMNYLFYGGEWNDSLIPENTYEMKAAERFLVKILNNTYIEGTQQKIYLFANDYMASYYQAMLRSPEWSHRMNGLYRALDFRLVSVAEKHIERWERKKVATIEEDYYLSLLKILTGKTTALQLLKEEAHHFSEHQNRALLLKLDSRPFDDLVKTYEFLPVSVKLALIDVIGEKNHIIYQDFLQRKLQTEDTLEIRIRLLKALDRIGYLQEKQVVVPFLNSPNWEERMLATRLIGTFPLKDSQHYLLPRLEDASWWVRSTSARAIIRQKGGISVLTDYKNHTNDRFAIEVIEEQLMKGEFV